MILQLTIKNFVLIESLNVSFTEGLSTITGETGTGKSLLLGALGLILGKRADIASIRNKEKKCFIEAVFNIKAYKLEPFFENEDLDYEEETYIRREILPSGKSRAFVNDSPVNLNTLQKLGSKLIDIHSQHQTLEITRTDFQFFIVDSLAKTQKELASFQRGLQQLKIAKKELINLEENQQKLKEEYDYNSHLYYELLEAEILPEEQKELEELQEKLANTEEIQERFTLALGGITTETYGAFDQLTEAKNQLSKITSYGKNYEELYERLSSVCIELDDLRSVIEQESEMVDNDPDKLQKISDRLQLLYNLHKKHQVETNTELLEKQLSLEAKVTTAENISEAIESATTKVHEITEKLNALADKIHVKREKVLPKLKSQLQDILSKLGMPNAQFNLILDRIETFSPQGGDQLQFLFSANKGGQFDALKKVASGGELSRIVLAVKMLLSKHVQLPTIVFDEIDTGVSGEVAQKMADLLKEMGKTQQVFSITHLPQIAAKGNVQYKVFKEDIDNITQTNLKELTTAERAIEIAEMIGGKQITEAAKAHAQSLLSAN